MEDSSHPGSPHCAEEHYLGTSTAQGSSLSLSASRWNTVNFSYVALDGNQ